MRVRPSLLLVTTALAAFLVAQTALGAPPGATGSAVGGYVADLAAATSGPAAGGPASTGPAATEPASTGPTATAAATPAVAARPRRPHPFRMAVVRGQIGLSDRPGAPAVQSVASSTEFGSEQVLSVAAQRGQWLGVVSSARANGSLGWVRRDAVTLRRTRWSLHADLSARTLTLRRGRRVVRRLEVAIGRPGSETPTGRFAVTDKLAGTNYGPYYGCCVLALNGHQPNTPPGWQGGDRLAIHGTDSPDTIGAAASAGCLRAADADLRVLMAKVPLGTPVFIRA